jgi:hypothetical protein
MNIAFGAVLAGASLGPAGWTEVAEMNSRIVHTASVLAGFEDAASPIDQAAARARAALPDLPHAH